MRPIFSDYERILSHKKNVFVDSFVKQYGEEYRSFFEKKYEEIDWCPFENPRRIQEYIEVKTIQMEQRLTFDVLRKLKLSTSTVVLNSENKLVSDDSKVQHILDAFFPEYGYICDQNMNQGIFSFTQNVDDEESLTRKAAVLKELNIIQDVGDMKKFVQTNQYEEVSSAMRVLLKDVLAVKRDLEKSFTVLHEYAKHLSEQENAIIRSAELKCIHKCKEFTFANYPNIPLKQFHVAKFFCSPMNFQNPQELPLAPGLLEYFLPDYTDRLQTSTSLAEKKKICSKRWEYLSKFDIRREYFGLSDEELYSKDWYTLSGLKNHLPDVRLAESIRQIRQEHQNACMSSLIQIYLLNNTQLPNLEFDDSLKEMLFFDSKHPVDHCTTYLGNSKKFAAFFCPKDANSDSLDFTLDHSVRHIMESFAKLIVMENEVPFLEKGTVLEEIKSGLATTFYNAAGKMGECNVHINEIQTQKLSIESTLERYERGEYILVPPDEAKFIDTSYYDQFISNFDLTFPKKFQEKMIESRLHPVSHFMPLYDFLNQNTLTVIDQNIMSHSDTSISILKEIGDTIAKNYCSEVISSEKPVNLNSEEDRVRVA